jgi:hypothetical protein
LLRLRGWSETYANVESAIGGPSATGKSLLDLKTACDGLGVAAQVGRSPIVSLEAASLPILVYGSHGRHFSGPDMGQGHFVVVVAVRGGRVWYLDGTTGAELSAPLDWLVSAGGHFTYLAVTSPASRGAVPVWTWFGVVVFALVAIGARRRRACALSSCRPVKGATAPCTLIVLAFAVSDSALAEGIDQRWSRGGAAGASDRFRRDPTNDGTNALFMFCEVYSPATPCDPELVRDCVVQFGRPATLLDLRNRAGRLGVPAEVLAPSPEGLAELGMPLIAHMDGDRGGDGRFVLLCGISAEHADYINAGYATWSRESRETFLRAWSGYVLAPTRNRTWCGSPYAWLIALGASALYIGGRLAWRRAARPHMAARARVAAGLPIQRLIGTRGTWPKERP